MDANEPSRGAQNEGLEAPEGEAAQERAVEEGAEEATWASGDYYDSDDHDSGYEEMQRPAADHAGPPSMDPNSVEARINDGDAGQHSADVEHSSSRQDEPENEQQDEAETSSDATIVIDEDHQVVEASPEAGQVESEALFEGESPRGFGPLSEDEIDALNTLSLHEDRRGWDVQFDVDDWDKDNRPPEEEQEVPRSNNSQANYRRARRAPSLGDHEEAKRTKRRRDEDGDGDDEDRDRYIHRDVKRVRMMDF